MTAVYEDVQLRLARVYLLRVAEPPAPALSAFVAEHGPVTAARRVRAGDVPSPVVRETEARRGYDDMASDLERAGAVGVRLIVPEDAEWPTWPMLSLQVASGRGVTGMAPPLALWVRGQGRLDECCERAVTVVGARAATGYGEHTAAEWSYTLAGDGVTVFSGAAYGIDAGAHRGALAAGGRTVAVLGCGIDAGYPAGHDAMFRRIAEGGLVVSEYPAGLPPARHRFLVRNRLLAALSAGTVVVEAGARSGARNTAHLAATLGKEVMAVPGPITSRTSLGCHEMIRSGQATLAGSAEEVAETVGRIGVDLAHEQAATSRPTDRLSENARRVHDALDTRAGKPVDQLAAESGVPAHSVRGVLCELELDGYSARCESGWLRGDA